MKLGRRPVSDVDKIRRYSGRRPWVSRQVPGPKRLALRPRPNVMSVQKCSKLQKKGVTAYRGLSKPLSDLNYSVTFSAITYSISRVTFWVRCA